MTPRNNRGGSNGGRRRRGTPSGQQRPASKPLLDPDAGTWSLDWSLVDRDAAGFRWPASTDSVYSDLAGFLARLNEMSLDEVMGMDRSTGKSAVHELETHELSPAALEAWERVYEANRLDEGINADLAIVTISYCLGHGDGRRVVVAHNRENRCMFPLWWDPEHQVSGADGQSRASTVCNDRCLHN